MEHHGRKLLFREAYKSVDGWYVQLSFLLLNIALQGVMPLVEFNSKGTIFTTSS